MSGVRRGKIREISNMKVSRAVAAAASDETSAVDIQVETFRGVVQLSGFVDTPSEKQAAKRIANTVEGVREVEDNLIVNN